MVQDNEMHGEVFTGKAIVLRRLESGIMHLCFDLQDSPVNKFDQNTLAELGQAVTLLAGSAARGLVCTSAKPSFIVGADIGEFSELFKRSDRELLQWLGAMNERFTQLETLPFPTVSVIDGHALGGGLELCLATDYRVASNAAVLGFPEVGLGICPGFGGSVRAPRVMTIAGALQWLSSGQPCAAEQALLLGAIDTIADPERLFDVALEQIASALEAPDSLAERRARKAAPALREEAESQALCGAAMASLLQGRDQHNRAPHSLVETLAASLLQERDAALASEAELFVALAKSEVARNLIGLFNNEQWLRAKSRSLAKQGNEVHKAAILGAGIMGGGIVYQSALKGVPVLMKDIAQGGLDAGMQEASGQLDKLVAKGRMTRSIAERTLAAIEPTLDYEKIGQADIVVEAVVENAKIKKAVLREAESLLSDTAILTSNTSTISITELATALQHPERFCGMHFFNPVPVMPLVEVIVGAHSSPAAVATTVAYAQRLGKTPIVVKDCPGFLVNRILFPYFGAFSHLLRDGADFAAVDTALEAFGWPMGPAYLLDVVGLDTAVHAQAVMAEGFPERMRYDFKSAIEMLFEAGEYGQKTGSGFYKYVPSAKGRLQKDVAAGVATRVADLHGASEYFDAEQIVARMMVAMCLETVRCLEDGIVSSAVEADMGLVLGLGFPKFRGGALRYIDSLGVDKFCALADSFAALGPLYEPTAALRKMAAKGRKFYP